MAGDQGAEDGEREVSIESRIRLALDALGYKVYPDTYNGPDKTYFVMNHNTIPDDFGSNRPWHERALIQVHLFCPHTFDSVQLRKDTKLAIFKAGFTYPSMVNANDEDGQHWVFEFQTAEATDGEN